MRHATPCKVNANRYEPPTCLPWPPGYMQRNLRPSSSACIRPAGVSSPPHLRISTRDGSLGASVKARLEVKSGGPMGVETRSEAATHTTTRRRHEIRSVLTTDVKAQLSNLRNHLDLLFYEYVNKTVQRKNCGKNLSISHIPEKPINKPITT